MRDHPALTPLRLAWSFARNGWVREGVMLRLRRPAGLFQPYPFTAANRYPRCFAFARETLGDGGGLNLLSFGCSTGEEAFTLARYFPEANIKGIDINARAIEAARRATPPADAARIAFEVASSADAEPEGRYDAVFAFAVFRDSALKRAPARCDNVLRFADFERSVASLARCLRPGGLFFLRHAHFRFADTDTAAGFDLALSLETDSSAVPNPVYGRDDRLVSAATIVTEAAWRKR